MVIKALLLVLYVNGESCSQLMNGINKWHFEKGIHPSKYNNESYDQNNSSFDSLFSNC